MIDSRIPAGALERLLAHIPAGALDFAAVPVKGRGDGWSPERQRAFVTAVAAGLGNSGAARAAGMSRQSAYRLRQRRGAESFAAAWDRALAYARSRPPEPGSSVQERVFEGIEQPIRIGGKVAAVRRVYDARALWVLLRAHLRRQGRL
jgi:hypothetical protein